MCNPNDAPEQTTADLKHALEARFDTLDNRIWKLEARKQELIQERNRVEQAVDALRE